MRPPLASEDEGVRGIAQRSLSATPTRTRLQNKSNYSRNGELTNGNSKQESLNVSVEQSRCQCCPYGFHIDLDFVKFAEDVVTGREQYQNWATPSKRAKRLFKSPFDCSNIDSSHGNNNSISIDDRNMDSSILDSTILSKSMDEGVSDFDDILQPDILSVSSSQNQQQFVQTTPQSILKNRSNSNVQRTKNFNIKNENSLSNGNSKPYNNLPVTTQQRAYISSPPTFRRINQLQRGNNVGFDLPLSTMPMPLRTSTPSKNVNEEIKQIFASANPTPTFSQSNFVQQNTSKSMVTSAPTSPVPKTFYTAIAQSMAQLKKLPPIPPPKSSSHIAATTSGALNRSFGNTNNNYSRLPTSGSGTAGSFNYNYNILNGSTKDTPPRRYFDGGQSRKCRVLSPEPENRYTPSVLRTSNLQSRSYYHGNNNSYPHSTKIVSSAASRVPYRYRGAVTMGSTLDMDAFASVRRQKVDDVKMGGIDNSLTKNSAIFWRSLSPPRNSSTDSRTAPLKTESYENFAAIYSGAKKDPVIEKVNKTQPITQKYTRSESSTQLEARHNLTPLLTQNTTTTAPSLSELDDFNKTNLQQSFIEDDYLPEVVKPLIFYNCGTQTLAPSKNTIGLETDNFLLDSLIRANRPPTPEPIPVKEFITRSTETSDLPKNSSPPTPPPKPQRKNAPVLSVEFQYCLGHEPEHQPGTFLHQPEVEKESPILISRGTEAINFVCKTFEISTSTTSLDSPKPNPILKVDSDTQTFEDPVEEILLTKESGDDNSTQTDPHLIEEWLKEYLNGIREENQRKSVDKITETDPEQDGFAQLTTAEAYGNNDDQFIMIPFQQCDRSSICSSSGNEPYEKIIVEAQHPPKTNKVTLRRSKSVENVNIGTQPENHYRKSKSHSRPLSSVSDKSLTEKNFSIVTDSGTTEILKSADTRLNLVEADSTELNNQLSPISSIYDNATHDEKDSLKAIEDDNDEGLELGEFNDEDYEVDSDRLSIETDAQTIIMVDMNSGTDLPTEKNAETSRQLDPGRADAIRKLLTEPQRTNQPFFQRDVESYRSYRTEKSKSDDLDYITDRHSNKNDSAEPSTPSINNKSALKEMVILKKPFTSLPSNLPEPIPAKIPRPKFTKYSSITAQAETPDEEDEAADRLTPLRSEMRSLAAWGALPRGQYRSSPLATSSLRQMPVYYEGEDLDEEILLCDGEDNKYYQGGSAGAAPLEEGDDDGASTTSGTSSDGGDTYELSQNETPSALIDGDFVLSTPLRDALETLNKHLNGELNDENPEDTNSTDWAYKYVQHEWLKLSTKRNANAEFVEAFIDTLEGFSSKLMSAVINMTDQNDNTALHYAVSHENYDVVSVLLDAKVCRVDEMNKAGYSAVMLGALCELKNETESAIIQRLFQVGNVNAKAVKHSQTALMLAASHGRVETTNLLINCGADVNIQDVDGSTSLMCAAEHGQKEIVKILLKRPNIDASLTDCDNQTALSIAVENQHRDIGVLIYAHLNFSRLEQNDNSVAV